MVHLIFGPKRRACNIIQNVFSYQQNITFYIFMVIQVICRNQATKFALPKLVNHVNFVITKIMYA